MQTLLLNRGYEPIRLVRWRDAVTAWILEKVEVVACYDIPLRSKYIDAKMPAVIRLTCNNHKFLQKVPMDRWHIYARDQWRCQYCGKRFKEKLLTYDHVVPRSRGGKTTWGNIVTACEPCNQKKNNRTPKEAGMPLLHKPARPNWMPTLLVEAINKNQVPEQWRFWIEWLHEAVPQDRPRQEKLQ